MPFFKQWGEWLPLGQEPVPPDWTDERRYRTLDAHNCTFFHVGKKAAGRLLDGREWGEFPEVSAVS